MRRKVSLLVALLVLVVMAVQPVLAITGGSPDGNGHPNVGAILMLNPESEPFAVCTGVLISEEVLLTSGICTELLEYMVEFWDQAVRDIHVSFDPDDAFGDYESAVPVSTIITHPDFRMYRPWVIGIPDVGVLILEQAVTGVEPEPLPSAGYLDALREEGKLRENGRPAKFTVVGYGTTLEWPPPVVVRQDGVRRVAESEFLNLRKMWLEMSQNPAPGNENGGTAWGDSGGPTYWVEEDGTEVLVAICSWEDMMMVAQGTAWRIDTPTSLAFLTGVLSQYGQ